MKNTIYHCLKVDHRYTPPLEEVVYKADTSEEAYRWLENNGGGLYRNILHHVEFTVKKR